MVGDSVGHRRAGGISHEGMLLGVGSAVILPTLLWDRLCTNSCRRDSNQTL